MAIEQLRELSDAATPGPWLRKWESYDVRWIGGFDALRSMQDIDFAVAAVAYVREQLDPIEPPSPERLARYVG